MLSLMMQHRQHVHFIRWLLEKADMAKHDAGMSLWSSNQMHGAMFYKGGILVVQEPRQKIIDLDTAVQMLQLAMVENVHLAPFLKFLQEQTDYKTINRDQWQGFGRFAMEVLSPTALF